MMRLYLDTCILNDIYVILQADSGGSLRKRDVKAPLNEWILEYVALYYLLELDDEWGLEFGTSSEVLREVECITEDYPALKEKKNSLLQTYFLLIERSRPCSSQPIPKNLLNSVAAILEDSGDAKQLCQALIGKWKYFITTDRLTILTHTKQLRELGIHSASPKEFLERKFMKLELLVRALHGSWTTLDSVVRSWEEDIALASEK